MTMKRLEYKHTITYTCTLDFNYEASIESLHVHMNIYCINWWMMKRNGYTSLFYLHQLFLQLYHPIYKPGAPSSSNKSLAAHETLLKLGPTHVKLSLFYQWNLHIPITNPEDFLTGSLIYHICDIINKSMFLNIAQIIF